MYSECDRSRDIDNLESKVRDLDFDISNTRKAFQKDVYSLERLIGTLFERIKTLEDIKKGN